MRVLFIGNSHTYYNDMPATVADICKNNGEELEITMLAGPDLGFEEHILAPQVRFNLVHGGYDAVVLQHKAHPQGDLDSMEDAGRRLIDLVQKAGSRAILFMPWSLEGDDEGLLEIRTAYRKLEILTGCEVAAVGELWEQFRLACPEVELYAPDGSHATKAGSAIAAACIAEAILGRELQD